MVGGGVGARRSCGCERARAAAAAGIALEGAPASVIRGEAAGCCGVLVDEAAPASVVRGGWAGVCELRGIFWGGGAPYLFKHKRIVIC